MFKSPTSVANRSHLAATQLPDFAAVRLCVVQHLVVFQDLVARANDFLRAGRRDAASVYAQIAAKYAASRHPGLFASPRLERILLTIGERNTIGSVASDNMPSSRCTAERVLHVFTQVAGIGGHTRMAWRWIRHDAERSHTVAITRQGSVNVPQLLKEAVSAAHGQIHVLDECAGNLITWADALRTVADAADLVVLHVNPDDVVPIIAFADKRNAPPVIFVNHADQLFWLGVGVSDLVVNLRESGARLSHARRGVPPERSALLPIVLSPIQRTLSRSEAKARIGIPDDAVLLLSIARPHKYRSWNGMHYVDALMPVLEKYPNVHLILIGPEADDQWVEAGLRTRGRVRALGVREDTAVYYQAADVYLDSFPVVSITSLLEAGSYGLPLVSRSPDRAEYSVLGADTPGLTKNLRVSYDLEEYRAILSHLIEDAGFRQRLGEATRQDIVDVHTGENWRRSLQNVYQLAASIPPVAMPTDGADRHLVDDLDLLLVRLFAGEPDLDAIIQFNLRLLPHDLRFRQWIEILTTHRTFRPGLLLPEWLGTRLERRRYPEGSDRHLRNVASLARTMP